MILCMRSISVQVVVKSVSKKFSSSSYPIPIQIHCHQPRTEEMPRGPRVLRADVLNGDAPPPGPGLQPVNRGRGRGTAAAGRGGRGRLPGQLGQRAHVDIGEQEQDVQDVLSHHQIHTKY